MLYFRSEAHLDTWLAGRRRGAVLPISKLAELSNLWWGDRVAPDWRPHSRGQNQAILDGLGLTGAFWDLG